MKIYEIRDVTDEETYYTKGFFTDKDQAIALVNCPEGYDLAEDPTCYDFVSMAVYEWETEMFEKGHKKIFEVVYSDKYDEVNDKNHWTHEVIFPTQSLTPDSSERK